MKYFFTPTFAVGDFFFFVFSSFVSFLKDIEDEILFRAQKPSDPK